MWKIVVSMRLFLRLQTIGSKDLKQKSIIEKGILFCSSPILVNSINPFKHPGPLLSPQWGRRLRTRGRRRTRPKTLRRRRSSEGWSPGWRTARRTQTRYILFYKFHFRIKLTEQLICLICFASYFPIFPCGNRKGGEKGGWGRTWCWGRAIVCLHSSMFKVK